MESGKKLNDLKELLTVKFSLAGKNQGYLRLFQGFGPARAELKPLKAYFVETEYSRAKVKIEHSMAQGIIQDLKNVLQ